ncbi:Uncharacterized protein BP5553_09807 [Venustampulla echinocandica]|uniref:F-box domain-containing protein n=1 Tax=Venustampulla echinocandica TaxID=2656787 RepID=A0A370TAT4_9HELO|nr:Uncharacterized protein BP5553_09807 [Venustampulla echinocandica]RDL31018.1 Uncharacterized protein BP5553_09807 [Venustampulla echinocandica]
MALRQSLIYEINVHEGVCSLHFDNSFTIYLASMDLTPLANAMSAIDMLPVEIIQALMSALPNVASLKSMALACPSFYRAFNDSQMLITTHVLLNEVDPGILPEAFAVLQSSRVRSWTRQGVTDFVSRHLNIRTASAQSWTLSDALLISKLHFHIHYFAEDFASKSLAFWALEHEVTSPSHTEIAPFNEIVEHDISSGFWRIPRADISDPGHMQPILARGLSSIRSIILANSYQDRYQLMYLDFEEYTDMFLFGALDAANEPNDHVDLEDYTADDELARIKSPFVQDPDSGPADVWFWAHQEVTQSQFINCDSQRSLRERGYVMWSRTRLVEMDVLQTPWEEPDEPPPTQNEIQWEAQKESSYDRRCSIYLSGGSGWWDFDDESKIVWPGGKAPAEHP